KFHPLFCSFFLALCCVTAALGQSSSSVAGTITDSAGAVVVDATITLINTDTAAVRTEHTDKSGQYQFAQVLPGNYTLKADHEGFGQVTVNNVQLIVST